MRQKRLLAQVAICCLLTLLGISSSAQTRTISGKVTDSTGAPIPGATVTALGAPGGTLTGTDGAFHLSVPASSKTLIVSYVGYISQQVPISDVNLRVTLFSSNTIQNEVVVIGYGTQQKKDLTGSIAVVSTKDFQKGAITSPDQLIAGKVAGVQVTSNGGAPGASSTIRIRGISSISSNNAPLIVLDGVELPSTTSPSGGTSDGSSTIAGIYNPLDLINPDDIESVTVLKDASAAAIYGSRASAGVIIITTKKGRGGRPLFNFNTTLTAGTVAKDVSVLSPQQFRNYVSQQVAANPADTSFSKLMGGYNTDWQKQIFQTAITNNENLSMSGAAGKIPYRISLGYHNETGILKTDQLSRGTVGIHIAPHLLGDQLKIELNLNGGTTKTRFANQGAIGDAIAFDPTQSPYQKGSKFGGYFEWVNAAGVLNAQATRNPLALLEQDNNTGYAANSVGNLHADYALPFLPGLHAIANLAYDVSTGHGTNVVPADAAQDINNSPGPGLNSKYKTNNTYVLEEYSLNYNKDIPSIKSNINVLGLYSYSNNLTTPYNYLSRDTKGDTISGSIPVYKTSPFENTLISYVGRVIYTYDQKYILTASIRDDGSSRFAPAERWGIFPAVSAAWRVAQEDFLRGNSVISDLKIRGSYGVTGNQDGLGDYNYVKSYSLSNNNSLYEFGNTFYNLYTPSAYNLAFKWEQTTSANVGIDFGLFNNRITGSIDYYHKNISNLFNSVFIPVGSNFTNEMTINVGTMKDEGVEFNINATPVKTPRFQWDLNFNFTYNKNEITKLTNSNSASFFGDQVGGIGGGTGNNIQIQTVGQLANSFYVLQQVYGKNGQPIEGSYVDNNRDGSIAQLGDAIHYHSPFPPVAMGFSTTLTYDKFSLSIVARSNIGNYVYNNVQAGLGNSQYILNPLVYLQNASTSYLQTHFFAPQYLSDYYVQNASFLKLDNLGLAYNLGKVGRNMNLRVSANCQNVFVITKYTGIDPEVYSGIDNNVYPRPRNFSVGASLNF
jgi:TonB-linked SusC/RagA family outer membrane protein